MIYFPMDKYGESKDVTVKFVEGRIYGLQRKKDTPASAYVGNPGSPRPNKVAGL